MAFWIANIIFKSEKRWKIFVSILVIIGSLTSYFLSNIWAIHNTIWPTECYGFIWGIVLATIRTDFLNLISKKWIKNMLISMILSLILGGLYLQYKWIPFAGDYLLKILLGIAITMFVLIANTRIHFGNKINMFLGEISFEIYLVHGYVFNIFEKYYEWNNSSVFIMMSIITTVMCSYIIHLIDVRLIRAATRIINV